MSTPYRAILTSHTNPVLSGVAKFNQILARRLEAPLAGILEWHNFGKGPFLLSLKLSDMTPEERMGFERLLAELLATSATYDLFFHTFDALPEERELVRGCRRIFCGNEEIRDSLQGCGKPLVLAWCPGLLDKRPATFETRLNLFSFGMAHKIQLPLHRELTQVLGKLGTDYTLWLSTAFHEKAKFGDFDRVSRKLIDIYGDRAQFLGFLSDDSVNYFLAKANAFVAFFEKGLRSNNTSVFAAMERGCPVITNLDRFSPNWLKHGENVLDIGKLTSEDLDGAKLNEVGAQGAVDASMHASWDGLTRLLSEPGQLGAEEEGIVSPPFFSKENPTLET